jgi:hypothetical protein
VAHTSQNIESLYDFLYIDSRKISSYLAQIDPNGALTGIKVSASINSAEQYNAQFSIPMIKGNAQANEANSRGTEKNYDPVWTVPVSLLNALDEAQFINRDISTGVVGQLVLIKGHLQVLDIRMLKDLWEFVLPQYLQQQAPQATESAVPNRAERRRGQRQAHARPTAPSNDARLQIEAIKRIPHSLQMNMICSSAMIWATLNPDNLLVQPDDFLLKHGSALPGEWIVLGVLDSFGAIDATETWATFNINPISQGLTVAADMLRRQFGRPDNSVAITPLMLFRKILRGDADGASVEAT